MTQQEIATHLGLSLKGARNMLARLQMDNRTHTPEQIRKAYIASLDKVGESRAGQLELSREKLKLMQSQRIKLKLETKKIRNAQASTSGTIPSEKKTLLSDAINQSASDLRRLIEVSTPKGYKPTE